MVIDPQSQRVKRTKVYVLLVVLSSCTSCLSAGLCLEFRAASNWNRFVHHGGKEFWRVCHQQINAAIWKYHKSFLLTHWLGKLIGPPCREPWVTIYHVPRKQAIRNVWCTIFLMTIIQLNLVKMVFFSAIVTNLDTQIQVSLFIWKRLQKLQYLVYKEGEMIV